MEENPYQSPNDVKLVAATKPLRFKFTSKGLLWATFWAAVSASCWAWFQDLGNQTPPTEYLLGVGFWVGPFAAIGALLSRPIWGIVAGGAVAAALLVLR